MTVSKAGHTVPVRPARERGGINTHGHVFDEATPLVPGAKYRPEPAHVDDYLAHTRQVGEAIGYPMTRAVITTASAYGQNNTLTVDTLKRLNQAQPGTLRGIVVVDPDRVSDETLLAWDKAGVRGCRVQDRFMGGVGIENTGKLLARFKKLNLDWHVEVWTDIREHADTLRAAAATGGKILIDHLGFVPAPAPGEEDAAAPLLRELMSVGGENNQVYVALEGAYRMAPGLTDADAAKRLEERVRTVFDTRADHVVWGSDWPYVAPPGPVPTTADHAAVIEEWIPAEHRDAVFVTSAEKLYGFDNEPRE